MDISISTFREKQTNFGEGGGGKGVKTLEGKVTEIDSSQLGVLEHGIGHNVSAAENRVHI